MELGQMQDWKKSFNKIKLKPRKRTGNLQPLQKSHCTILVTRYEICFNSFSVYGAFQLVILLNTNDNELSSKLCYPTILSFYSEPKLFFMKRGNRGLFDWKSRLELRNAPHNGKLGASIPSEKHNIFCCCRYSAQLTRLLTIHL